RQKWRDDSRRRLRRYARPRRAAEAAGMNVSGNGRRAGVALAPPDARALPDPLEPEQRLFADLRSRSAGLETREVERRLTYYGRNEITRRGRRRWWREVA